MAAARPSGVVRQSPAGSGNGRGLRLSAWLGAALLAATPATLLARADGPDAWNVRGIAPGQSASLHAAPSLRSAIVGKVPHDAKGLVNLGCKPAFDAGRRRPSEARWCRVEIKGKRGWISSRYLAEGAPAPVVIEPGRTQVGAWFVECANAECTVEQTAGEGKSATRLRIEPRPANNARIEITRVGIPDTGVLTIAMDGRITSSGPLAPLRTGDGLRLVLTPDDITSGLLKQMARYRAMTIALPGDAKGTIFNLARFREALDLARRQARGTVR